jgi:hypothetical protein
MQFGGVRQGVGLHVFPGKWSFCRGGKARVWRSGRPKICHWRLRDKSECPFSCFSRNYLDPSTPPCWRGGRRAGWCLRDHVFGSTTRDLAWDWQSHSEIQKDFWDHLPEAGSAVRGPFCHGAAGPASRLRGFLTFAAPVEPGATAITPK